MYRQVLSLSLAAASLPFIADANETRRGGFGASASTNGVGVECAYSVSPRFDVRAGYDFGSLPLNQIEQGITYDSEIKFSAGRLLLDFKPFGGGFRLSGGLYTRAPELDMRAAGSGRVELNGRAFNADVKLDGAIELGGATPYVGLGWGGSPAGSGFGASLDAGVLFTGAPRVTLSSPSGFACDATQAPDCSPESDGFNVSDDSAQAAAFASALETERQDLGDDAKDVRFWPVVRVGLHYRF